MLKTQKTNSIESITIEGYKCFKEKASIKLKPLTVLAGTNSAGKSSFMQPILLQKQTLEAAFDPGALLLNGTHVRFSNCKELLNNETKSNTFSIDINFENGKNFKTYYQLQTNKPGFKIEKMSYKNNNNDDNITIYEDLKKTLIENNSFDKIEAVTAIKTLIMENFNKVSFRVNQHRCFLDVTVSELNYPVIDLSSLKAAISNVIHLPGLRGIPERSYPTTFISKGAKDSYLPGTFGQYVASILLYWHENDIKSLQLIHKDLQSLEVASSVEAKLVNDTETQIYVSFPDGTRSNIADVGLGVSQVLPILVALRFAKPGQIVYIEQPEIHLHPNAQYALAKILSDAAKRGVKVVIETHSYLIIRGLQTIVVKEGIEDLIALHWFTKRNGKCAVHFSTMDSLGAYGDWPADFDDVTLKAEVAYLDAVEAKGDADHNAE